jgi:hypothetical protein
MKVLMFWSREQHLWWLLTTLSLREARAKDAAHPRDVLQEFALFCIEATCISLPESGVLGALCNGLAAGRMVLEIGHADDVLFLVAT